jgi:hypothetical protein
MEINRAQTESSNHGAGPPAASPVSDSPGPQMMRQCLVPTPFERFISFLKARETLLWWLHSTWALLFGFGVMWLGSKNYDYLRLIVFHITFIWLSSLFLPVLVNRSWLSAKWREWVRLVINYFNRNFYQQLLFFLLPIYYASTTFGSRNVVFLALLAVSAVISTLDIVYDRYLSVKWQLTALFFMFNLFAAINVILPVLWTVSNHWALRVSAVLALGGFASMLDRLSGLRGRSTKWLLGAAALGTLVIIVFGPPYIPPAPLSLASVQFGRSIRALQITAPLESIPSAPGRIVALTAIKAPMGMEERIRHRWYLDGKVIFTSNYYVVMGGRKDGYRVWTQITWMKEFHGRVLMVDVETQGGQLIGRAQLMGSCLQNSKFDIKF